MATQKIIMTFLHTSVYMCKNLVLIEEGFQKIEGKYRKNKMAAKPCDLRWPFFILTFLDPSVYMCKNLALISSAIQKLKNYLVEKNKMADKKSYVDLP